METKPTSSVWFHFKIDNRNSNYAICNICRARISRGGVSKTTSAMKKHLKIHSVKDLHEATLKSKLSESTISLPFQNMSDPDDPPAIEIQPDASESSKDNEQKQQKVTSFFQTGSIQSSSASNEFPSTSINVSLMETDIPSPVSSDIGTATSSTFYDTKISPVLDIDTPSTSTAIQSMSSSVFCTPSPIKAPSSSEKTALASSRSPLLLTPKRMKTSSINQPTLAQTFEKTKKFPVGDKRRQKITSLITEMICTDLQPISIVENRGFRKIIKHLEPRYSMVSRKYLACEGIPKLYFKEQSRVKLVLDKSEFMSCTFDFWTSIAEEDYMSFTVHFIDDVFEQQDLILEVIPFNDISHSAQKIQKFFESVVEEWGLNNKIVAVIHDSAANMIAAMNLTEFEHMPCFAHQLQTLIHHSVLSDQSLSKVIANCKRIVKHFKHSTKGTKTLKECQMAAKVPQHRLIQSEPTRWDSTYLMIARLIEQRPAISLASSRLEVPAELTQSQWNYLEKVEQTLKIFYEATKILSKKETSASEIIPLVNSFFEFFTSSSESGLQSIKNELISRLKLKFQDLEKDKMYVLPLLLDPRFKNKMFRQANTEYATILENAKHILITEARKCQPSCNTLQSASTSYTLPASTENKIYSLYSKLLSQQPVEEFSVEDEVTSYLSEGVLEQSFNPISYWKTNIKYPTLRKLAKKYLCIKPASVYSERAFSAAGTLVDKKRNRLDAERVRMILFLHYNLQD